MWGYRIYKGYKAVKNTAKLVKTTYKVAKKVKKLSSFKKSYKVVKAGKKAKRIVSKPKASKKLKKVENKSYKKSRVKTVQKSNKKKVSQSKSSAQKTSSVKRKTGCFVAGTKISSEKGFKNIEDIKVGDRVWSEDTKTGKKALKRVKKIFVREKDSIIRLTINGETIETTQEHPFWIKDQGWIPAGCLREGDIVKLQNGQYVPIEEYKVILLEEPILVYNFHVEDYECYYVSTQKVLVHNMCAMKTPKYNNKEITELAEQLGYKKTNVKVKNQIVFKKGRKYIVQDIDSHNGGVWKMANSVKKLKSKKERLGTYDKDLNRIGD